ncbi:M16 family metallopeptidase [Nanoarchaeota archaeon]
MKVETLDNGLTAIAMSVPGTEYLTLHVDVGFGTYQESQLVGYDVRDIGGSNHFIEHLIFGKNKKLSSKEISELDRLCEEVNAEEGVINTDYWADLFQPKHLDHVLETLANCLFGAQLRREEVEVERDTIASEIWISHDNVADMDENSSLKDRATELRFKHHPLRLSVLGTESSVRSISRKDLFDLYKSHYVPNNTIMCLAGAIDEGDAIEAIGKRFGRYKARVLPELAPVHAEPKMRGPIESFQPRDLAQNYMLMLFRTTRQTHRDRYTIKVIDDILDGGTYGRLFRAIRSEHGLSYSPQVNQGYTHDEGYLRINSQAPPGMKWVNKVRDIVLGEMRKLATKPVTAGELRKAKDTISLSHNRDLTEDMETVTGDLCAMHRIGKLNEFVRYPDMINRVTAADVQRVTRKYLHDKPYVLVAAGPKN